MDELEFEVHVKCEDTEDPKAETRGRISIDDTSYQDISLIGATEQTLKFKVQIEEGEHTLRIDHLYSPDSKNSLQVTKILIDDIDLGVLAYNGVYTPQYPEPWYTDQCNAGNTPKPTIGGGSDGSACLFMGWEGKYELEFRTPLYEWLLENI